MFCEEPHSRYIQLSTLVTAVLLSTAAEHVVWAVCGLPHQVAQVASLSLSSAHRACCAHWLIHRQLAIDLYHMACGLWPILAQ